MGKKSDKKVKSERVNALRKQYDAFLEEDKKRRERNEYILGRLDNMRYATTAVQIRHKPVVYGDVLPVPNRVAYRPDQFGRLDMEILQPTKQITRINNQNLQLDTPRPYLGDTSLLKEISKKYILIPKLRASLIDDYVGVVPSQSFPSNAVSPPHNNFSSNEDWKSKYEILEQLKKNEKEEKATKYVKDELFPVKECQILAKDNSKKVTTDNDLLNYNTKEYSRKYEQEVPEKDLAFDKFIDKSEQQSLEKSKIDDSKGEIPSTDHTPIISATIQPENNEVFGYTLQDTYFEHKTPAEENVINTSNTRENVLHNNNPEENDNNTEYNVEEVKQLYNNSEPQRNKESQEYPVEYEQLVADENKFPEPENVYLDQDVYNPIEIVNSTESVQDIQREDLNDTKIKEDDAVEYPTDIINDQEFTPNDDVKLEDGVNVNPVYSESDDNVPTVYDNVPKSEPIDQHADETPVPFDAGQCETFHSDETDTYAYEQQQQPAGDASTPGYAPTEVYQPPEAQDYTYYEGATEGQEQEYPVELNEHEEAASRYDQNYEQQYAGDYEQQAYDPGQEQQYEQPLEGYQQPVEGYQQPVEGYQQPVDGYQQPVDGYQQPVDGYQQPVEGYQQPMEGYQQPVEGYDETQQQQQYQDYEYQQADHETVQNVEQVLDKDQGFYVETQNLEASQAENPVDPQAAEHSAP